MIELTPLQKEIIDDILGYRVKDIDTFITKYLKAPTVKDYPDGFSGPIEKTILSYASYNNMEFNRDRDLLIEFYSLCEKLHKLSLISKIESNKATRSLNIAVQLKQTKLTLVFPFLKEYYSIELYPMPELSSFKKRGYRTYDEYNRYKDNMSQWWRTIIAVGISTIISVATMLYSVHKYTTQREVNIKEPIRVIIENSKRP